MRGTGETGEDRDRDKIWDNRSEVDEIRNKAAYTVTHGAGIQVGIGTTALRHCFSKSSRQGSPKCNVRSWSIRKGGESLKGEKGEKGGGLGRRTGRNYQEGG